VEDWDIQPAYIQNVDYYILPVSNPDGYEYTHQTNRLWRKNLSKNNNNKQNWLRCKGTDLNRNFGYHWGEQGQSQQPCSEIYSGSSAFSEPETRAQQNFFAKSAAKFRAFLTFHSYGQYILYPWGYDRSVPADHAELDRVGKLGAQRMRNVGGAEWQVGPSGKYNVKVKVGSDNTPNGWSFISGSLLYAASGGSDDWAKSMNIKYAYTVSTH
jgi:carboxypeptidase A4